MPSKVEKMNIKLDIEKINAATFPMSQPWMGAGRYVYLFAEAGRDHYRLLSYISSLYNNIIICDVGTKHGLSAIALASPTNKVYSYDTVDKLDDQLKDAASEINCTFLVENCLEKDEHKERLLSADIVMLDTDHDGVFEEEFYSFLKTSGFSGILILDDIRLNEPMKKFWDSITEPKFDITKYGHFSGTGLVTFGEYSIEQL